MVSEGKKSHNEHLEQIRLSEKIMASLPLFLSCLLEYKKLEFGEDSNNVTEAVKESQY